MTRSRPLKLAALALLVLGLGLGTPVGLAQRTITVCPQGCQYAKIQEAINAASEGDTIQVKAGTYQENLTIIKRLTLQGEGKDKVTIQGTVTILSAKLVTLSGFTFKGGQGVQIEDSTTIRAQRQRLCGEHCRGPAGAQLFYGHPSGEPHQQEQEPRPLAGLWFQGAHHGQYDHEQRRGWDNHQGFSSGSE
jgi:hypothetical protein